MRRILEFWYTNRIASHKARMGRYWCNGCDANLVTPGRRCKVCGRRPDIKRWKRGQD